MLNFDINNAKDIHSKWRDIARESYTCITKSKNLFMKIGTKRPLIVRSPVVI